MMAGMVGRFVPRAMVWCNEMIVYLVSLIMSLAVVLGRVLRQCLLMAVAMTRGLRNCSEKKTRRIPLRSSYLRI
jgi:hypothetical protein